MSINNELYISINGMKRKALETSKQFYSEYVNYYPIYTFLTASICAKCQ